MGGRTSFFIIIITKYSKQASKRSGNKHSKSNKIVSEGYFSALYVIIKVPHTAPWTFFCPTLFCLAVEHRMYHVTKKATQELPT